MATNPEPARMDAIAAEVTQWDRLKTECTQGYVMWAIWPSQDSLWGKPNGRVITPERRTEMYRSFLAFGIQNVKNDTVITVVAKKSWIKKYHQVASIDGLKPSDIPTLEWTTLGKAAFSRGEFCPSEGLGRRGGLGK